MELYRRLTDRHGGGAFDVLRQYANLSALGRVLFGWREPPVWIESQGAAYLVVNENVPNLIPSVPLVAGAGGVSVDFAGAPLAGRPLRCGTHERAARGERGALSSRARRSSPRRARRPGWPR